MVSKQTLLALQQLSDTGWCRRAAQGIGVLGAVHVAVHSVLQLNPGCDHLRKSLLRQSRGARRTIPIHIRDLLTERQYLRQLLVLWVLGGDVSQQRRWAKPVGWHQHSAHKEEPVLLLAVVVAATQGATPHIRQQRLCR